MAHKILVVEDDEPILELMDLLIHRLGYDPVLMPDGQDALEYVWNNPPALILLDIMMTPVDGWEFLEKLRSRPAHRKIPVIIFSASPAVDETMATLNDPLLSVLHKPVSFTELKDSIERSIGKR